MRTFLYLWILPMSLFGVWYGLSANDWNLGMWFFSREIHDEVMTLYAATLGVRAEAMPGLLARALVIDTLLVMTIMCWRHRVVLAGRVRRLRAHLA